MTEPLDPDMIRAYWGYLEYRQEPVTLGPDSANLIGRDIRQLCGALLAARAALDEALAKTDGGEWATRYYADAEEAAHHTLRSTVRRPNHTHQRRVWLGPVGPVTDDGGAS